MTEKEILRDLVKFDTIKDKQNKKITEYIEKYLKKYNFKTEYKTKNLVMSIGENSKLGFLGHTDTVQFGLNWSNNPFELKESEGRLYGIGTCDMKGGIAALLKAVTDIDWRKCKKGIKLYFTYDEEIGFSGIRELMKKGEEFPNNMIIGEPTNNVIKNASKGLLEFKLLFTGVSVHSSEPEKGENAIEKSIDFINELKEFYNILKKEMEKFFKIGTTMNIGKINGGKGINIVPDTCELLIDFRIVKKEHTDIIIKKIETLSQKYGCNYEILNNIKPFINYNEKISPTEFITEASFLNVKNRYILGVGPNNSHKSNEYVSEKSLTRLVEQYKKIIYKYCR